MILTHLGVAVLVVARADEVGLTEVVAEELEELDILAAVLVVELVLLNVLVLGLVGAEVT